MKQKKNWNIFWEDFTFLGELHKTAVKWVLLDEFVENSRPRQSEGLKRLWKRTRPTFVEVRHLILAAVRFI